MVKQTNELSIVQSGRLPKDEIKKYAHGKQLRIMEGIAAIEEDEELVE